MTSRGWQPAGAFVGFVRRMQIVPYRTGKVNGPRFVGGLYAIPSRSARRLSPFNAGILTGHFRPERTWRATSTIPPHPLASESV